MGSSVSWGNVPYFVALAVEIGTDALVTVTEGIVELSGDVVQFTGQKRGA